MIKKKDLKKLALLGLTSGLVVSPENGAADLLDDSNAGYVLAAATKHGCPGQNGCPAAKKKIVASRDVTATTDSKYKAPDAAKEDSKDSDPNAGNLGYYLMTEDELLIELNDEGVKKYKSLSPEGKKLALEVASMRCASTNACQGLNACKTEHNDCAGKGSCKGQGKCAIADKNLAVQLVYDKMAQKRSNALSK